jgi:hypothetical protein
MPCRFPSLIARLPMVIPPRRNWLRAIALLPVLLSPLAFGEEVIWERVGYAYAAGSGLTPHVKR